MARAPRANIHAAIGQCLAMGQYSRGFWHARKELQARA
jgi:hypothetical protein